ncbi:NAD dehydrogenase [Amanita muscaria]
MSVIRGLKAALNASGKYGYKAPETAVDFLVIGGGVVGLAIAQRLSARYPSKTAVLVDRHAQAGEETSSRNSEVIHAGLYYPDDSLKTRFCLRGRDLLYERCEKYNIPHSRLGKLVVALPHQRSYIENLHAKSFKLKWPPRSIPSSGPVLPTELLSGDQAREYEPDLSKDIVGALWSPTTGIIDSHAYLTSLEKDIVDSEGGQLVYSTRVVRIDPYKRPAQSYHGSELVAAEDGWVVQIVTGRSERNDALFARTIINAAGLSSAVVLNSVLPEDKRIPLHYARGSYGSYHGPGVSHVSHLIYPCPETRGTIHGFHSLGTHLTLDLNGKVKFGPDIEWISPPEDVHTSKVDELPDFWTAHLVPNDTRLPEMYEAVKTYLPGVVPEGFQSDYVGIRPKIAGPKHGFQDFTFREDYPSQDTRNPMISLLNIESPGLTSSLAIAEYVVEDMVGKYKY